MSTPVFFWNYLTQLLYHIIYAQFRFGQCLLKRISQNFVQFSFVSPNVFYVSPHGLATLISLHWERAQTLPIRQIIQKKELLEVDYCTAFGFSSCWTKDYLEMSVFSYLDFQEQLKMDISRENKEMLTGKCFVYCFDHLTKTRV